MEKMQWKELWGRIVQCLAIGKISILKLDLLIVQWLIPILLATTLWLPAQDAKTKPKREPHPFAPSLPLLTEKEEAELDAIINRFMLADIGQLKGVEAQKAIGEFSKLGPSAIPALIRGVNRAAKINHSCPVLVIARKLDRLLRASKDTELLQFARDEIGAGVGATRHQAILKDLRLALALRKNYLARQIAKKKKKAEAETTKTTSPGEELDEGNPKQLSTDELAKAVLDAKGQHLERVLNELGERKEESAVNALAEAARATPESDKEVYRLSRTMLVRSMTKQKPDVIKKKLTADKPELRAAAIFAVARNELPWMGDLIERLDDENASVRGLAHRTLVQITRVNFGPGRNPSPEERQKAVAKWKKWWQAKKGR